MISANSLVFPKPRFADPLSIQDYLVYIPKNVSLKHFYASQKDANELKCVRSSTVRLKQQSHSLFEWKGMKVLEKFRSGSIPCVYLKGTSLEKKLIIYFHSNAEDIVSAFAFVQEISKSLGRSVLMMQYPGYSVYTPSHPQDIKNQNQYCQPAAGQTTAEDIEQDALKVVEYAKEVVGFNLKDITVLGRSIGSGPAVYVSSIYAVGALILLSPFMSLCHAVRDLYGQICAKLLVQRFNNIDRVQMVQCPSLLIHGLADTIIPCHHSIALAKQFKSYSYLKLVENMKHNSFHFHRDFIVHVQKFLRSIQPSD